VLIIGKPISGSKSWLGFGSLGIQPAELAKAASIIALSSFFHGRHNGATLFKNVLLGLLILLPLVALISLQPDFGSAMVFMAIFMGIIFVAGVRIDFILFVVLTAVFTVSYILLSVWDEFLSKRTIWFTDILSHPESLLQLIAVNLVILALAFIGFSRFKKNIYYVISFVGLANNLALIANYAMWRFFKNYQLMRLATFLNPNIDAQGAGYQVIQSITAVGSGGLWGKGFLQGTQSHLRYLPEQSTDFIFSIIAEESGLIGALVVIFLYCLILYRLIFYIGLSQDNFGKYLCAGTFALLFFHVVINIGMVIGLVPITGIPLLLLSYGGSSVLVTLSLLGLCSAIYRVRYHKQF
jgi:rod shape determining protein RodA